MSSRARRGLWALSILLSLAALVAPARLIVARLAAPRLSVEYGEGFVLASAEAFARDGVRGLYPARWDTPPLVFTAYPPLMYGAWAVARGATGDEAGFLPGRSIVVGALLLAAVAVFWLPRCLGSHPGLAAVAALTVFATPTLVPWLAVARVDLPGVAFALVALACAACARGPRARAWVVAAVLAASVSLGFKQSLVAAPLAIVLDRLLVRRYAAAIGFAGPLLAIGVAVTLALNAMTEGGFWRGTVMAPRHELHLLEGVAEAVSGLFASPLPLVPLLMALPLVWLGWRGPERLVTLYLLVVLTQSTVALGKVGSNTNYLIEAVFAAFVAAPVGVACLARRFSAEQRRPWVTPAAALVLGLVALASVGAASEARADRERRVAAAPQSIPVGLPARGFVWMNPEFLPLTDVPAARLYWNDPYSFSLEAALDRWDGEIATGHLRDGTIARLVEPLPLDRQPLGRPEYPGDWRHGWSEWSYAPWLAAARANFRPLGGQGFVVYGRADSLVGARP